MKKLGKLTKLIKNPQTLYDIGVGPYPKREAELFKAVYGGLKVFGCEPHPDTYQDKKQNFPGQLKQLAIGRQAAGKRLFFPSSSPDMSSLYHIPNVTDNPIQVNCMTLDQFDFLCNHSNQIILWVDVEGAESEVILSGHKLMSSGRVKWVNVEVRTVPRTECEKINLERIPELLTDYGYIKSLEYLKHKTHHDELWSLK